MIWKYLKLLLPRKKRRWTYIDSNGRVDTLQSKPIRRFFFQTFWSILLIPSLSHAVTDYKTGSIQDVVIKGTATAVRQSGGGPKEDIVSDFDTHKLLE